MNNSHHPGLSVGVRGSLTTAPARHRIAAPHPQTWDAPRESRVNVEIVKRSDQAQRFVVLPKRWIVERTFAWLGRCRRLAKDWECLNRKALAFLKLASIRLMLRKLCNPR